MRHKWNIKLCYLLISKKRILSLKVTSEQIHDSHVLPRLVDDNIIKQNKVVELPLWMVPMTIIRFSISNI
ncbi:MAG TPA: hypothetical protein VFC05_02560 [Nitrososphaeraceae archaeon]|jgi:hypothetical protein|nr:hypothetical protein [Nitrososphaeraceae archaeon]